MVTDRRGDGLLLLIGVWGEFYTYVHSVLQGICGNEIGITIAIVLAKDYGKP
jgi:hypothetical protein